MSQQLADGRNNSSFPSIGKLSIGRPVPMEAEWLTTEASLGVASLFPAGCPEGWPELVQQCWADDPDE